VTFPSLLSSASSPPPRISRLSAAFVLLLGVAACDGGDPGPLGPTGGGVGSAGAALSSSPGAQPFYWFGDTRIPLEEVPGKFVVKAPDADAVTAAREALADLELDVASGGPLIRGHRLLEVSGAGAPDAREVARRLRQHAGITFAAPNHVLAADGSAFVPLETFMVKFRAGTGRSQIEALNAEFGTTVVREPEPGDRHGYHHLRYPETGERSILGIVAAYHESPLTEWADPNRLAAIEFHGEGASQEFFSYQWYLDDNTDVRDGVPADINARPAWDAGFTGAFVTVAVLDSGIDGVHEDLAPMAGGDFTGASSDCDPSEPACQEMTEPELDPVENDYHGTAVAGILAALNQADGTGVAGIAPGVELFSVRVGQPNDLAPADSLAAAIRSAVVDLGADVINGSWGKSDPGGAIAEELERAVNEGRGGKGTVLVFSAGNKKTDVAFPANDPNTIAVSGLAKDGSLWVGDNVGSNTGPEIEIAAFSGSTSVCDGEIVTTDLSGVDGCDNGPGGDVNYMDGFSGTSRARCCWRRIRRSRSARCGTSWRARPTGGTRASGTIRSSSAPASSTWAGW